MSDFVKNYWEEQGRTFGASHEVSWGDLHMINLEVDTLSKYISPAKKDSILDVGCGNGYSANKLYEKQTPQKMVGVDFAPGLINIANQNKVFPITFVEGDAKNLEFEDNSFDIVYTTRCIINLLTWDEQKRAIKECIRVAKQGGLVLLSEAFWEPLQRLNSIRLMAELPPLVMHDFNRYLHMDRLLKLLSGYDYEIDDFSSIYYLGSRILREIVTPPQDNNFLGEINTIFSDIEKKFSTTSLGTGIQNLVIIRKL